MSGTNSSIKNTQQRGMWLKWQQRNSCFRSRRSHLMLHTTKCILLPGRRRSVTGLSVSGTWKKTKLLVVALLRINQRTKTTYRKQDTKNTRAYIHDGTRQNACSCLLACVVALCCLVDANVLLHDMYFAALCRADCRLFCCAAVRKYRCGHEPVLGLRLHLAVCPDDAGSKRKKKKKNSSGTGPEKAISSGLEN